MIKKNPNAFTFKSVDDLNKEISKLGIKLQIDTDLRPEIYSEKVYVEGKEIPNRFCAHPMEGCDGLPDGSPGELTLRRYKRFAKGGTGLIWVEATAVIEEAKANPRQLSINKKSARNFKNLVGIIRKNSVNYEGKKQNPFIVLQLTHSGRYSKPEKKPAPIIFHHSPFLDPTHKLDKDYPLITDKKLDELQEYYLNAAKIAYDCGFDAVDIKSCHGYLLQEILSAHTRKDSKYGGDLENRIRFIFEVISKIRKEIPKLIVTSRLNVYDAVPYPYGWGMKTDGSLEPDMKEPIFLMEKLKELNIKMINVAVGNPYYNPHIERPYDYPVYGTNINEEHPLKIIARNIEVTAEISKNNKDVVLVGSGFSWLRELSLNVTSTMLKNKWCDIVGLGRIALANPDFANEFQSTGKLKPEKLCITCSSCTQIMRDGGKAGCVIRDSEIYKPIFWEGRFKDEGFLKTLAESCRECWGAACVSGCPAGMKIPDFINAFIKGNLEEAYRIMKENNALPETCSYLCPTEVLCEKNCTAGIIDWNAIPIHEIQKFIASKAREKGLTKVIPGKSKNKSVAVIGFGPAGISCSVFLIEKGYKVCVFEASDRPGGIPIALIPAKRLPAGVFEKEIDSLKLEETGLFEIRYRKQISEKFSIDSIFKEGFDSVFIGAGLNENVGLDIPKKPKGVYSALDLLKKIKEKEMKLPSTAGVIGGGNTAMDVACSLKDSGVTDVYIIYRRSYGELPAWPREVEEALNIGVHFLILNQPIGYIKDKKGKIKGVKLTRTRLGEIDSSGRRSPVAIPGSEYIFPVSLCVEAIGQTVSEKLTRGLKGVIFERGRIKVVNGKYSTTREGVFAGGDIVNGGKTVVQAVKEGMEAAEEIDISLT